MRGASGDDVDTGALCDATATAMVS